ncbi:MAG: heavy metal translocating P-type ATPase, partial [Candidatus Helarchaeota archaeon]
MNNLKIKKNKEDDGGKKQGAHNHMNHSMMKDNANDHKMKHMDHKGHANHHKMMVKDFKKRFIVSMILTVPILLLSPLIQEVLNLQFLHFIGDHYILFG